MGVDTVHQTATHATDNDLLCNVVFQLVATFLQSCKKSETRQLQADRQTAENGDSWFRETVHCHVALVEQVFAAGKEREP